jgi:lysophospholipase L1-like esterase
LYPHIRAVGARYVVSATSSTYTTTWAHDPELDRLLGSHPALVLITLGANEWDMPIPRLHAAQVDQIVQKVSRAAPCVWITPPSWKKDTGFLDVIHDHAAPCLFFDSDAIVAPIARQRDGIHPNEEGGAVWAGAFWEWLEAHRDPERGPWALVPFERRKRPSAER